MYNKVMNFSDWITNKYIKWRGNRVGSESTVTAFADYIGVPQQVISGWMKKGGKTPKSSKYITLLAAKYPEIYEILGIPSPETQEELEGLPPSFRRRIRSATAEVNRLMEERGLSGEDPEAEELTIQIFEKWGFKYASTEIVPDKE
jgi:hypothetical protein